MIERKILQLWVGPKPLPPHCAKWCDQFRRMNPGWSYHFYSNELFDRYAADPYIKRMRETDEKMAFIADRFRVLLLRDEGGVYIDSDARPIKSLSTLDHVWSLPHVDFVAGLRSPDRRGVALHRGITFLDNTVMASAKNGLMANRLCGLYHPEMYKQTGYSQGLEILRSADETTVLLNYKYFYAESLLPESVILHDSHNLASWVPPLPPVRCLV